MIYLETRGVIFMNTSKVRRILFHIMAAMFFGILFFVGTFNDEDIAQSIYIKSQPVALVVTTVGLYPFFGSMVLFFGALFQQVYHSGKDKPVRVLLCTVCAVCAAISGFAGSSALVSVDCLGEAFPSLNYNYPVIAVISVVLVYPLFPLGYRMAAKSEDKDLVRLIMGFIVMLLISFVIMEAVKSIFCRPRYRIVVRGLEGIGFIPWYTRFEGAKNYISAYGLESTDLRSFPSGHSLLSISCIYLFPALSVLFPKLKGKENVLSVIGLLFGMLVMFTRMVLGAHYLSDVSAGALIGVIISFISMIIQNIVSRRRENRA